MRDVAEPTMEEILASIRRIIAEDGRDASPAANAGPRSEEAGDSAGDDDEMTLDEAMSGPAVEGDDDMIGDDGFEAIHPARAAVEAEPQAVEDEILDLTDPAAPPPPPQLVSEEAATLSASTLAALSSLVVSGPRTEDHTLEGMVREMLRPMLKEWLDARLPEIVERLVAREIARITGKSL